METCQVYLSIYTSHASLYQRHSSTEHHLYLPLWYLSTKEQPFYRKTTTTTFQSMSRMFTSFKSMGWGSIRYTKEFKYMHMDLSIYLYKSTFELLSMTLVFYVRIDTKERGRTCFHVSMTLYEISIVIKARLAVKTWEQEKKNRTHAKRLSTIQNTSRAIDNNNKLFCVSWKSLRKTHIDVVSIHDTQEEEEEEVGKEKCMSLPHVWDYESVNFIMY